MPEIKLRLMIELVPITCWTKSLRNAMRRSEWDKLRKRVYAEQDNKCRICGGTARLSCHELWEYDDAHLVQRLIGLEAVCGMCHHVTHFGRSEQLAVDGHLDLEAVIEHFLKVNGVTKEVFESHKQEAFRVFRERSMKDWKIDFGEWRGLAEKPG